MIYWSVLSITCFLALLNPREREITLALLASWAAAWVLVEADQFQWLPYGEAAVFYAVLFMLACRFTKERVAVLALSGLTLILHAVYWFCYGLRLDLGTEYMYGLKGLYLASMAILAFGGWDELRSRVGAFLEGLGGSGRRYSRPHHACSPQVSEKAGR